MLSNNLADTPYKGEGVKRDREESGDIQREGFCVFVEISSSVLYGSAGAGK